MPRPCVSHSLFVAASILLGGLLAASHASAEEAKQPSLHERIDALIQQGSVGPSAALCSDADFVRRLWLDLAGMIPPADEVRAFLADTAADKREKLIDRLLASPQFNRHMTLLLDAVINERRADKGVTTPDWQAFLYKSLTENKPLDQLLREVILSDGADANLRPAAKFMLDRDCEPNVVTRDIGRLVFGMDLQCAQCHDHPLVDDYLQADYYGLYAFVLRSSVFADPKNKATRQIAETADGEANFKSVFTGHSGDKVQPRLPKGLSIFEPVVKKGEEYVVKPSKETRAVPKFSRRKQLAETFEDSIPFRRNLANRLWAQVMGRGLVHPVDNHHPANPPAHPQVLTMLADEVPQLKYDLRSILRELLLTNTYQRSCEIEPPSNSDPAAFDQLLTQFTAVRTELTTAKDQQQAAWKERTTELEAVRKQLAEAAKTLDPLKAAVTAAQAEIVKSQTEITAATTDAEKKKAQAAAVSTAATKAKEAADLLKDDKVLIDAAAKLAERAKALETAEAAGAKKVADLTAALAPLEAKETEAQAALDKETAALPAPAKILELETAERTANAAFNDAQYALADLDARESLTKRLKQHAELQQTDVAAAARLWNQLVEDLANRGQIALLKPLSAEQFALSTMQAAGLISIQQQAAEVAMTKSAPEEWKKASDADKPAVMKKLSEPKVFENVRGQLNEFVRLYGGLPGQDFQATVNQALFFGNGSVLETWLKPTPGNLLARMKDKTEPAEVADELYFAVLNRGATADEITAVADFLKDRTDRDIALSELTWALLASSEFRFNH
ncbi:DUF1549 domain-containing protein [Anatilimnocola sp. NA78]|uniref:DUF1549 domain-containing protein n=1 Tax=Anatilimnocola sp. NA78 TaxID=3415683 RepID=UPI003CE4FA36